MKISETSVKSDQSVTYGKNILALQKNLPNLDNEGKKRLDDSVWNLSTSYYVEIHYPKSILSLSAWLSSATNY